MLGVSFAIFAAPIFLIFPSQLIGLYLAPANVEAEPIIDCGTSLLAVAAAFQVVDSLQAIAGGLLRGLKDTRFPMFISIL